MKIGKKIGAKSLLITMFKVRYIGFSFRILSLSIIIYQLFVYIFKVSGDKLVRNTDVESIGKKMLMIIEPYQNVGIEVTQTCGNVTAKRIFKRI